MDRPGRQKTRRFLPFLLVLLLFNLSTAFAQDGAIAVLAQPQITEFPFIHTSLIVRSADGAFIGGLTPADITVIENEQRLEVSEFTQLHPGALFAVALNPGRPFAIRDGQGISRYDNILAALRSWAEAEPAGDSTDYFSLLVNYGPQIIHTPERGDWLTTLLSYQGDPREASPTLDVLTRAVEVVSDDAPDAGMGRGILFITPIPEGDLSVGLQSLAGLAVQNSIHISVWLVASPDAFQSPGAVQLRELTELTGGQLFAYSGTEAFPDPEQYLAPLRDIYVMTYRSQVAAAGANTVSVEVQKEDLSLVTETKTFTLNLLPPVPVVIDPPGSILRENRDTDAGEEAQVKMAPEYQDLELMIQFPDGIQRPIASSTLYVDGSPAAVQTAEPFDQFRWDLRSYLNTADHLIRVEVVDSQGMVGKSADIPVRIEVNSFLPSAVRTVSRNLPWFAGFFVLLAGSITFLVLILTGRIRPRIPGQIAGMGARMSSRYKGNRLRTGAPSSEADESKSEKAVLERVSRFAKIHWPKRRVISSTFAHLIRLTDDELESSKDPAPITSGTMTIGTDRLRCDLVLEDPSVDPVHAALMKDGNSLCLKDSGSTAGTWVNYKQVPVDGTELEHGDIIHIGRVALRLKLREPARIRKPVVIREELES